MIHFYSCLSFISYLFYKLPIYNLFHKVPIYKRFYKLPNLQAAYKLQAAYFIASYIYPIFAPRHLNPHSEGIVYSIDSIR